MKDGNSSQQRIDLESINDIADRIVAANLANAIYTRLNTIQSHHDYDESTFDDVARNVVHEVMQTYSALLKALRDMHDDSPGAPDNSH